MAASANSWVFGALVGFTSAFFIQLLAGHWKLWVDHRKAVIDDLVKAIDSAKAASVSYFEQAEIEAGPHTDKAREAFYTHKVVTDLFGILDRRFGPATPAVHGSFRDFREAATGEGFLRQGKADKERAANITIAAASCSAILRDWSYSELSPFSTLLTTIKRRWRWMNRPRPHPAMREMAERLTK